MKKLCSGIAALAFILIFSINAAAQSSFIVLGDIHIDRFEDHDMDYVRTRPQDFAQISKEYPFFTATYLPKLLEAVKRQSVEHDPPVCAAVQLGDLMQGVAGNDRLSRQMARNAVDMLYGVELTVPWLITKGNHDVSTSPGQPEAWREVVEPFIERQTGKRTDESMYVHEAGDFAFFVLDQFFSPDRMRPETDIIDFLEREFPRSKAKYKFLVTHQPVIPVTERCWHLFADIRRPLPDAQNVRSKFLNLLASHKVVVLCAHLHKYSKIVRETESGPLVQIMFNSVVNSDTPPANVKTSAEFPSAAKFDRKWQPHTNEKRLAILKEEAPHIKSYSSDNRAGYGIISAEKGRLIMRFYPGFSREPADEWIISDVYR